MATRTRTSGGSRAGHVVRTSARPPPRPWDAVSTVHGVVVVLSEEYDVEAVAIAILLVVLVIAAFIGGFAYTNHVKLEKAKVYCSGLLNAKLYTMSSSCTDRQSCEDACVLITKNSR